MIPHGWRRVAVIVVLMLVAGGAHAASRERPDIYSANDFGGVGLLNMRTARFAPDGQFETGAVFIEPYRRYYMTWQILPWAEVTFRYTDITNVIVGRRPFEQSQGQFFKDIITFQGGDTFLDRAFDFKFRIWDEGRIRPEFAIGFQDTIGTGLFSSEYMAFSKRIADFDVTLGFTWGYLGNRGGVRNPFRLFSSSFDTRGAETGEGGKLGLGNFFSGRRMGIYGGIQYFTPIKSLSLKLEFNGADPANEPLDNAQPESLPIGFGLNYRPFDWFDFALAFERGNAVMVRFAIRHNLHEPGLPHFMDPPPPPLRPRPEQVARARKTIDRPRPDARPVRPVKLDPMMAPADEARVKDSTTPRYASRDDYRFKFAMAVAGKGQQRLSTQDFNPSALTRLVSRISREESAPPPRAVSQLPLPKVAMRQPEPTSSLAGNASGAVADGKETQADALFKALKEHGYAAEAVDIGDMTATLYYASVRFRSFSRNLGRIARIVANHLPARIEAFTMVYVGKGMETSRVTIFRKDLEQAVAGQGSAAEIWGNASIEPVKGREALPETAIKSGLYPELDWSFRPRLRQNIGDPDVGLVVADLLATLKGSVNFTRNLSVSASVSKFVFGNLDKITRDAGSALPHVRSDLRLYLQEGRNSLDQLQINYLFRPGKNLYGRLSGGIFEMMYGGVGGEILYHQPGSPLALGVDLNWVKKRDFDQDLGFQDYDVVTGHLNVYYDLPFYDMHFTTHIGRYLAKDWGATFNLSRRFDSGIRVGGFFTQTTVSAREFGEGSFDKGFYMSIPLDMFLLRSSTRYMSFAFRPLTRDGGQMVGVGPRLYGVIAGDSNDRIRSSWTDFLD